MMGSIFAETDESPEKNLQLKERFINNIGMGSIEQSAGSSTRYFQKNLKISLNLCQKELKEE